MIIPTYYGGEVVIQISLCHTHTKMISSIEATKSLVAATLFAFTSRPSLSPFLSLFLLASFALAPLRLLLWGALFLGLR